MHICDNIIHICENNTLINTPGIEALSDMLRIIWFSKETALPTCQSLICVAPECREAEGFGTASARSPFVSLLSRRAQSDR